MKKYAILTATVFLFSVTTQAVPLMINNNSDNGVYPERYTANAYLGFLKDGSPCNMDDNALLFSFGAGSSLYIGDGSFNYNGNCLSSWLGFTNCDPIDLDWHGQRFWLGGPYSYDYYTYPLNLAGEYNYPAGMLGLSTGAIHCHPSGIYHNNFISQNATYYDMESYVIIDPAYPNDLTDICRITYNRYGNTIATLIYQ